MHLISVVPDPEQSWRNAVFCKPGGQNSGWSDHLPVLRRLAAWFERKFAPFADFLGAFNFPKDRVLGVSALNLVEEKST